jgi:hypothetical protein
MHRPLRAGVLAAAALSACAAACADDVDITIFGPVSHSSVAVFDTAQHASASLVSRIEDQTVGELASHTNTLTLEGLWAITPRFNVEGALRGTAADRTTRTLSDVTTTFEDAGPGGRLDASAWLYGDARLAGPGVALSAGLQRQVGNPNRWFVQLSPQWRNEGTLIVSVPLRVSNAFDGGSGALATASLHVSTRVSPALTLEPEFGVVHHAANNSYTAWQTWWGGLVATWHVDPQWSASLEGVGSWQTDRNTQTYANDVQNGRAASLQLGLRRTF